MIEPWYLYLLECQNGRLYSGIPTDVATRFDKHKRGKGAMFARVNPPRRIVAATVFESRGVASKAAYRMKQLSVAGKLEVAAAGPKLSALPTINAHSNPSTKM